MSRPAIPRTVWMLGVVSLLMDVSSEMVQTLLPVYMVTGLGVSVVMLGLIEGAATTIAMATRLLSGMLSDWFRQRKTLTLIGYGLAALSKPIFPMADSALGLFGAKFMDRVGKGIRSAPRDAMIADVSPPEIRGASFGLRKSLDTVGGFLGPLIAIALMLASGNDIKLVFWIAVIPAFLAIAVLALGVREPPREDAHGAAITQDGKDNNKNRLKLADALSLNRAVWMVILLASLFSVARFSEAFLLLRAQQIGWSLAWLPLVVVVMHVVYGLTAYPAGVIQDKAGPKGLLIASMACLIAADLVFALAGSVLGIIAGVVLWGVHMGLSQGVLASLVAATAPKTLRGTAFGVLNLGTGLAVLAGNVAAGLVWEMQGAQYTFYLGAVLAGLALVIVAAMQQPKMPACN